MSPRLPAETPRGLREAFTEQSRRPFETNLAECLREGFVKPSRCLHEAFTQWARRGASAKGSRRLHERFMKTSRALKAPRSLREGFAKASRRLQPYPRRLLEGFAKAPRAPPFGNDSSDNDKPLRLMASRAREGCQPVWQTVLFLIFLHRRLWVRRAHFSWRAESKDRIPEKSPGTASACEGLIELGSYCDRVPRNNGGVETYKIFFSYAGGNKRYFVL